VKIQDIQKKYPPFDVAEGLGHAFISQGTHVELTSSLTAAAAPVRLEWSVRAGSRVEDYDYPPVVRWKCVTPNCMGYDSGCKESGTIESFVGTAHKTAKIFHQGSKFTCPEHIAEEYVKAFAAWAKRVGRKPPKPAVSPATPLGLDRLLGAKTHEELLTEAIKNKAYPNPGRG